MEPDGLIGVIGSERVGELLDIHLVVAVPGVLEEQIQISQGHF